MTEPACALTLSFWGIRVELQVPTQRDHQHFRYYFRDYLCPGMRLSSDLQLRLDTESGAPFVDGDEPAASAKLVYYRHSSDDPWTLYDRYIDAPNEGTPIPPLTFPPLSHLFKTYHASAVGPPTASSNALIIHGPSLSGKTVLALALLHRGWYFIADDAVIVDQTGQILRYTRPVGVRQRTLELLPWLARLIPPGRPRFVTDTGVTTVVHPTELGFRLGESITQWRWTAVLERQDHFAIRREGADALTIGLDVSKHLDRAVSALEELVGTEPK